jgi:putative tricarboxylic transport membrane protein
VEADRRRGEGDGRKDAVIRIRSPQDFAAGLLFMGLAGFALWIARDYPVGTAVRMSSGYFPRLLCFLLMAIGIFVTLRALKRDGPAIARVLFRPLVLVTAAVVIFAYTIQTLGVVAATVLLVLIGGYASPRVRLVEMAAAAVVLALLTVAIFIWGIGLPIPVWPDL